MLKRSTQEGSLLSPCSGRLVPLSELPDEAFSSGMLGKGVAVEPSDATVRAPMRATLQSVAEGKHAYALSANGGPELLIHVGVDTVTLGGKGFELLKEVGDPVLPGEAIARFSPQTVRDAGLCCSVILLITNPEELSSVREVPAGTQVVGGRDAVLHYRTSKKG